MKKLGTGQIYRAFKNEDENTVIRKLNMRMYCEKENINYTICNKKWMIDFDDFMKHLNPKNFTERKTLPRLRTKETARKEWNSKHRRKIKRSIITTLCKRKKAFLYKHGRYNIINYDELEKELIKIFKEKEKY